MHHTAIICHVHSSLSFADPVSGYLVHVYLYMYMYICIYVCVDVYEYRKNTHTHTDTQTLAVRDEGQGDGVATSWAAHVEAWLESAVSQISCGGFRTYGTLI